MGVGSAIAFFVFAILVPIAYMAAIASGEPAAMDPNVSILVGVFTLFMLASGIWELMKSRRRQAEPIVPAPTTPPPAPTVPSPPTAPPPPPPPSPIKVSFVLTDTEEEVLNYITKHGGRISLSQASRDLGLSEARLKATINKLKEKGKLEV
ncbi:MAG: hypothetical protein APU95_02575 [Hadesarchaea archaeon YNP_N21]|jgi:uncharacterized membrane protein|nr:MAG: hypothetical protein APU95_02575 [Hadesarchaea archaeon YNP_N21]